MLRRPHPESWMQPITDNYDNEPDTDSEQNERRAGMSEAAVNNMCCPNCGQKDEFIVVGTAISKINKLSGHIESNIGWTPDSECQCPGCHWTGQFSETQIENS